MVNDVAALLNAYLIIDCHSFPSVSLPYELSQSRIARRFSYRLRRTAFCIPRRAAYQSLTGCQPLGNLAIE